MTPGEWNEPGNCTPDGLHSPNAQSGHIFPACQNVLMASGNFGVEFGNYAFEYQNTYGQIGQFGIEALLRQIGLTDHDLLTKPVKDINILIRNAQ